MSAELDRAKASVTAITSAAQASNALVNFLGSFMRDHANDPAALTAMADELDADTQSVTDAVLANTPAAPTPPATIKKR